MSFPIFGSVRPKKATEDAGKAFETKTYEKTLLKI
jgi:hypothetical protein